MSPRDKPVASGDFVFDSVSIKHEIPRDKPVVSFWTVPSTHYRVSFGRLRRSSHITRNVHQIISELMATPVPFSHYGAR
jgi:hypothetical protein